METNRKDETPHRVLQVIPRPHEDVSVAHLPDDVEQYYRDAIRVLDSGVPDAAAVQLRRTLEAAAARHKVDKGSLVSRIQGLIKAGLITKEFGQVLDHIRKVGNIGAHASDERLDEASVRKALGFTTQVLRNLFEIPEELRLLEDGSQTPPEHEEPEASTAE